MKKNQMLIIVTFLLLFTQCVITNSQSSFQKWLDIRADIFSVPIKYLIHLEPKDPVFSKIKRSITEDIKTEETVITNTEIITNDENKDRDKRTISNGSSKHNPKHGPNLNVKAGLRYHHQHRHPNGSVSGSYAILDPKGSLQVMHYESDDKGYREYPEIGEPGSQAAAQNQYLQYQQKPMAPLQSSNVDIMNHGNFGNQAINLNQNNSTKSQNNRRDITPIQDSRFNVAPNIAPPYNIPNQANLGGNSPPTNVQSSIIRIEQKGPKSPLFNKYYRPSPEEVRKSYDYYRSRTSLDPSSFRPPEADVIPDIVRDKPMQITGLFNEYQTPPYQVKYNENTPSGYVPPQVPIDIQSPVPTPQELVSRQPPQNYLPPVNQQFQQPYPENVPAQPPLYFQAFDQQAFPPVQDAYPPGQQQISQLQEAFPPNQPGFPAAQQAFPPPNGFGGQGGPVPYVSNGAIVNQPYPPNIPIYEAPVSPNIPTYSLPPPSSIPIYNQQLLPGPGPAPGLPPGPAPTYIQPPPNNIPIYNQPGPGPDPGLPPGPAPAYIQPPPNNIPIYNQQPPLGPGPPGNSQIYYASGSTPQPKTN